MEYNIAYLLIGAVIAAVQKEPNNHEQNNLFIYYLLLIVLAWPIYILFRLFERGADDE
ncbi:hypothetical protein ACTWP4_18720 [Gracilibacillus sp. D59]|uniref:hypothetical protein n=1 Tax=Gracilibacillus sp. D59 TaxID=3457434 RepID=UPI003FCD2FDB